MTVRVIHGDCLAVIPHLVADGVVVDAVVTDPPYGLEFMGKEWDGADGFRRSLNANDAERDSVFGRTSRKGPEYRTVGVGRKGKPGIGERETDWVSNSGWNNSRCAACGHLFHGGSPCLCDNPQPVHADNRWNLFQAWNEQWARACFVILRPGGFLLAFGGTRTQHRMVCAIEDAGFVIQDTIMWLYGSGFPKNKALLKPAFEPIVVAYKPGGARTLQVNECRIPADADHAANCDRANVKAFWGAGGNASVEAHPAGRYPSNVILSDDPEVMDAFAAFGERPAAYPGRQDLADAYAGSELPPSSTIGFADAKVGRSLSDTGSAARFFFSAKAGGEDRWGSKHPTVKNVELIKYLVKLVCPPGGSFLDCFAGSGTSAVAALATGRNAILIEREDEYISDINERLAYYSGDAKHALSSKNRNTKQSHAGPLFD